MVSLSRSSSLVIALIFMLAAPGSPAAVFAASPLPPQLPSPADLALLQSQIGAALNKVRSAQSELDRIVKGYQTARSRSEALRAEIAAAQTRQQTLTIQGTEMRRIINGRAAQSYRTGPSRLVNALLGALTFHQFTTVIDQIEAITAKDSLALATIGSLKDETIRVQAELEAGKAEQQQVLDQMKRRQAELEKSLGSLGRQYDAVRTQLENSKSGFVFPLRAPYSYVDTWGAPRSGGRSHQGTDIFAARGTPVYAVVNGVIEKKEVNALGGNKLWLRSPGDNWTYYYAHLNAYAPGIGNGMRVQKGQVLGYVGTSGNAAGTPPHLHIQTHNPTGSAVNPYPVLMRVNPIK